MKTIPVQIQWDKVDKADLYVVYVQPSGCDFTTVETPSTSIILNLPARRQVLVYVTAREGQLESIASESLHIYAGRW